MKKFRTQYLQIICVIAAIAIAIYMGVYKFSHPDMTDMRIFLNNWKWLIPTEIILIIGMIWGKEK